MPESPPKPVTTRVLAPDHAGLQRAVTILADGGLVAFPTETVYGLGADARNDQAAAKIYEAKGRPRFNPLIVHVTDLDAAEMWAEFSDPMRELAHAFWPGPLTIVAPMRRDARGGALPDLVTAGLPTVALRAPDHPTARALLERFGGPVAAPSANLSGRVSPTTADHVLAHLDGRIDAVIKAGACKVGLESTIVGIDGGAPVLLRPGGLPEEALAEVLGCPLGRPAADDVTAPGQLESHYAPNACLRLNAAEPKTGERWLGFGPDSYEGREESANLSPAGDLREAAANLFGMLHRLDAGIPAGDSTGITIAVAPVPETGLGLAINDRLRRGATRARSA